MCFPEHFSVVIAIGLTPTYYYSLFVSLIELPQKTVLGCLY
jgi:hypothetical protein